jgi:hypothetical protein
VASIAGPLVADEPGIRFVDATSGGRRSRIAVFFHASLRETVESRLRFVLDRQRPTERSDSRRAAFVPYDNRTGLTVLPGAWRDWSDVRERVGTAILLQEARDLGWGDPAELEQALGDYQRFVVEHVVLDDGTVLDDSERPGERRLYNSPWFARFLLDQGDLERAAAVMDRYYADGGEHFLAFELGPVLDDLAGRLDERGCREDAARMRQHLVDHARRFVGYGRDLPAHEVNYEQSMVAPLLELLLSATGCGPTSSRGRRSSSACRG